MEHITSAYGSQESHSQNLSEGRDRPLLIGYPASGDAARMLDLEQPGREHLEVAIGSAAICALCGFRDGRWVSFSRFKGFYAGLSSRYHPALSYAHVTHAVDILERHGLIEVQKGKTWSQGGKGVQSRFRHTDLLLERMADFELKGLKAPKLREPLRLVTGTGGLVDYKETANTYRMRADLNAYNAFVAKQRFDVVHPGVFENNGVLSIPTKDGAKIDRFDLPMSTALFRQFNGDWRHHGRFYGGFWQNLPKHVREHIRINGEPVAKADFGNSHVRIAYSVVGADPGDGDAYIIPGYGREERDLVKVAVNIAINSPTRTKALHTIAWGIAVKRTGDEDGAKISDLDLEQAGEVLRSVEYHHAPILPLLYTGSGLRFMATEADVVAAVMKACTMRGIVVLPIHDELVTPARHLGYVTDLMRSEWAKRISVPAIVR